MTRRSATFPALAAALALALAGCGGGGDTPAAVTPPSDDMKDPPATKTAEVPDDRTVGGGLAGLKVTLAAGDTKNVNGWWYTCEGGTCSVEVPAGTSVSAVSYTGTGTLTIRTADHRLADTTAGTAPRPEEATDPLSNDVLLKALKASRTSADDGTVWNASSDADPAGTVIATVPDDHDFSNASAPASFTPLGGPKTSLWIDGDTDAYWGIWKESTTPIGGSEVNGKRGVVWGGDTPYGKKPDTSLGRTAGEVAGTALYEGEVLLYHSPDGKASSWTEGSGDLSLTANFRTGMVGGSIGGPALDGVGTAEANDIALSATAITSSGTFSGSAKFSAPGVTRQSGSWNGGFFGETLEVVGGVQDHLAPSHVAGEFRVTRAKVGDTQTGLHVRGAFGAACDDQC